MQHKYSWMMMVLFQLVLLSAKAQQPVVTLDYYFNNEYKKGADGQLHRFHYAWEDEASSGYSIWGDLFRKSGARINSLETAPTAASLKGADVYIITDPDTDKETAHPNYISDANITAITAWVKAGGVLVLMANDSANTELKHLNKLAAVFGIHFKDELYKHWVGNEVEMGAIQVPAGNPVFTTAKKVYLKDIAPLGIQAPATAVLTDNSTVVVATAKYGKGTVFAVGDPWFYNEYTNGRLPASAGFENDKAAGDVARWLLQQAKKQ